MLRQHQVDYFIVFLSYVPLSSKERIPILWRTRSCYASSFHTAGPCTRRISTRVEKTRERRICDYEVLQALLSLSAARVEEYPRPEGYDVARLRQTWAVYIAAEAAHLQHTRQRITNRRRIMATRSITARSWACSLATIAQPSPFHHCALLHSSHILTVF